MSGLHLEQGVFHFDEEAMAGQLLGFPFSVTRETGGEKRS